MTPQGFRTVRANLTRVGVAMYHVPGHGVVPILRDPKEVFSPENIAAIQGSPLTLEHPPGGQPVTSANAEKYRVGHVKYDVKVQGEYLSGGLQVEQDSAIEASNGEARFVSLGYHTKYDMTPGEWRGLDGTSPPVKYAGVQRKYAHNHAALTRSPRLGHGTGITGDSNLNHSYEVLTTDSEDDPMKTVRILLNGKTVEVVEEHAPHIEATFARLNALDSEAAASKKQLETDSAELATLRAENAELSKQVGVIPQLARERYEVMLGARALLPAKKLDALDSKETPASVDEIRRAVVTECRPKLTLDSDPESPTFHTPEYVRATFDQLVEDAGDANVAGLARAVVRAGSTKVTTDSDDRDALQKRIDAVQDKADNAWRNPTNASA